MESKQFIEYLNTNIHLILSNLKKNLDINQEESTYLGVIPLPIMVQTDSRVISL